MLQSSRQDNVVVLAGSSGQGAADLAQQPAKLGVALQAARVALLQHLEQRRRLALARSDGRGHAHWVATAAAVHLEAGSRSASATAFARWKRRKQMSSVHASTASTPTNGLVGSESESLPSLSVMFPLPSGRLKKDSTLATLRSLANQLQRLNNMPATNEIRGAKGTEENCGGMHASHSAGGRASICHEHVQLILLGSKPLCEER